MKRTLVYVSGTRADYGLMKYTLQFLQKQFEVEIIATGMHLLPEFGHTVTLIENDGFRVRQVQATSAEDTKEAMALFIGDFIRKAVPVLLDVKPDIIVVLGDRAEMLGAAIIGSYLGIAVAHLHGGEVTSTVDEMTRHAITKLAHLHLPATEQSAERIRKMGEDDWRIHVVGAPGLDGILKMKRRTREHVEQELDVDLKESTALILQHPVSLEIADAAEQMRITIEAVLSQGLQALIIYPNADAGGREMIKVIESYRTHKNVKVFSNLPFETFISLMSFITVMVGNSSSGMIESSSLGLPVVNIGSRQEGRERAANVIDVGYDLEEIKKALVVACSTAFKKKITPLVNPYGDGDASEKIALVLQSCQLDKRLLQKKLRY